jgi:exosortase/archaeosortase family protein
MFPTDWKQKFLVPIVAVLIAFSVNGVRISILAFLVAFSRPEVFEYWHIGQGSLIFSFISAIIFGLFCHFMLLQNESKDKDSVEV